MDHGNTTYHESISAYHINYMAVAASRVEAPIQGFNLNKIRTFNCYAIEQ